MVASLDHPHIVPVFDVGTADGLCFVVSKMIEGSDLARRIHENPLNNVEAAGLIATVADALHHAHCKGLVHRDIKPANILLDTSGKPYVADFGLALKDADIGKGARFAGTPAYMSPEQARGEGHRVDGRSDIFSLAVVFYELLTCRRPFHADSQRELLEQVCSVEARPPRQWVDAIPKELERICLKALSKRAADRYTTAKDLADDLRHFLAETHGRLKAHALRDRLLDANTADVPAIVDDMDSYRRWVDPLLQDAFKEAEARDEARKQLHASLALLPVDAAQVDYLYGRLLDAAPHEVPVIRDALMPHNEELLERLWAVATRKAISDRSFT